MTSSGGTILALIMIIRRDMPSPKSLFQGG